VGNVAGRSFTGLHGDGTLNKSGDATVNYWPGINGNSSATTVNSTYASVTGVTKAAGSCFRGGVWTTSTTSDLEVSNRIWAAKNDTTRNNVYGGRGVRTAPFTPAIGQSYGGGIIFYIDGTGQHGLIAAASDQSTGAEWGCAGTSISGADGTAIGTGNQNTLDIMAGCGTAGIAARLCGDLVLNSYSDWYLPSKDELYQMYVQKTVIGGFTDNHYWSSTETNSDGACSYLFYNGDLTTTMQKTSNLLYVRAIRSF
jgi:hypothetical protein